MEISMPPETTAGVPQSEPERNRTSSHTSRVGAKTLVVWNPHAGSVATSEPIKRRLLQRPNTLLCEPDSKEEALAMVRSGIADGCELVVAAGGDGTINSVLNAVTAAKEDVCLAVLPVGTANDWCASLMIPDDLDEATQLLDTGRERRLDVIEAETPSLRIRFANMATGGNSERVSESLTEEVKRRWGALCYMRGAIDVLSHLETYEVRVAFDDGPAEVFEAWSVLVANGRTSGGRLEVAPHAKLDDGLMDVIIIRDGNIFDVAALTARLALSDYTESEQVVCRRARKITIESDPPLRFALDGDAVAGYPTGFHILPAAQRVVVGDQFPEGDASDR